jgi:NAD(P)H-dependent FMN reductase
VKFTNGTGTSKMDDSVTVLDEARNRRDRAIALFNQDLEDAATPTQWTAFRRRVKAADAVLFVTPEHNWLVPAALKNALDPGRMEAASGTASPVRLLAARRARSGPSVPIII